VSRLAYASLSLLAYTYVGYPAVVAALSRLRPLDVERDDAFTPQVSVLIPVYNARSYVRAKLESLLAQTYPKDRLEIIVYSDGSTDGSDDEVATFADRGVVLIRATERHGKPTALNEMRKIARGEVYVLTDIRQVLSTNAVRELVSHLADERVGCVSGNLELVGGTGAGAYWRYENFIRSCEARYRGMVGVTGPLYAMRASDLPEVPRDVILDDMWIPLRLRLRGKRLLFAKDAVALDDAFEDDREKGRKVRTLAGNFQLFSMVPKLLSPFANPSFFETVSHKALRLAGPVLMAGALGGTLLGLGTTKSRTERKVLRVLLVGQGLFGLLALAGKRAGKMGQLARTFVVLNSAAVEGFVRFARQKQEVTW
jgi:cellulose synthase/poly-beta-1,6-N-acetylglucosamine synthase-like glycosyltransferase